LKLDLVFLWHLGEEQRGDTGSTGFKRMRIDQMKISCDVRNKPEILSPLETEE